MTNATISLGSPSAAIKAKQILSKSKIKARIIKLDEDIGCTHALELDQGDLSEAIPLLRKNNIKYSIR